jgi:hypothetical protein
MTVTAVNRAARRESDHDDCAKLRGVEQVAPAAVLTTTTACVTRTDDEEFVYEGADCG